jgi:hypothetical protein
MESKIIIKANGKNPIGAIQSISYKEDEQGIAQVHGDCTRTIFNRFDRENLDYVFYNGIVSPDSQKVPLNIIIFGISDIEVLKNVWIDQIGTTYTTADLIIVEPISLIADYIYKF